MIKFIFYILTECLDFFGITCLSVWHLKYPTRLMQSNSLTRRTRF